MGVETGGCEVVRDGVDLDKGLGFGVCNPVATQVEWRNVKVLAFEVARQDVLAVFATLQR